MAQLKSTTIDGDLTLNGNIISSDEGMSVSVQRLTLSAEVLNLYGNSNNVQGPLVIGTNPGVSSLSITPNGSYTTIGGTNIEFMQFNSTTDLYTYGKTANSNISWNRTNGLGIMTYTRSSPSLTSNSQYITAFSSTVYEGAPSTLSNTSIKQTGKTITIKAEDTYQSLTVNDDLHPEILLNSYSPNGGSDYGDSKIKISPQEIVIDSNFLEICDNEYEAGITLDAHDNSILINSNRKIHMIGDICLDPDSFITADRPNRVDGVNGIGMRIQPVLGLSFNKYKSNWPGKSWCRPMILPNQLYFKIFYSNSSHIITAGTSTTASSFETVYYNAIGDGGVYDNPMGEGELYSFLLIPSENTLTGAEATDSTYTTSKLSIKYGTDDYTTNTFVSNLTLQGPAKLSILRLRPWDAIVQTALTLSYISGSSTKFQRRTLATR